MVFDPKTAHMITYSNEMADIMEKGTKDQLIVLGADFDFWFGEVVFALLSCLETMLLDIDIRIHVSISTILFKQLHYFLYSFINAHSIRQNPSLIKFLIQFSNFIFFLNFRLFRIVILMVVNPGGVVGPTFWAFTTRNMKWDCALF